MSEIQIVNIGALSLEKGGVIEDCKIAYRTFGQLNKDKSNVLLFPTWYGGTSQDLIDFGLVRSGMYADCDKYYVITVDALGDGLSCSPSHYPDNVMPGIGIPDMINSQHKLLTEQLDIDHINTVLGISMGGMQVYEWLRAHPDFMDNGIAIIGTPKPTAADIFLWVYWRDLTKILCELPDGERKAIKMLAQAEYLASFTPAFINAAREDDDPSALRSEAIEDFLPSNSYDHIAQLEAMINHDISRNDDGDLRRTAAKIKARLLTITSRQDLSVNPSRPTEFAEIIGGDHIEVDHIMGHFAVIDSEQVAVVNAAIQSFLA
jgi:homoserine O-acetyltransferase